MRVYSVPSDLQSRAAASEAKLASKRASSTSSSSQHLPAQRPNLGPQLPPAVLRESGLPQRAAERCSGVALNLQEREETKSMLMTWLKKSGAQTSAQQEGERDRDRVR